MTAPTLKFNEVIRELDKMLKASQGANVVLDFTSIDGHEVRVTAFVAGGAVRPGSFRSNWFINGGNKIGRDAAAKIIR